LEAVYWPTILIYMGCQDAVDPAVPQPVRRMACCRQPGSFIHMSAFAAWLRWAFLVFMLRDSI